MLKRFKNAVANVVIGVSGSTAKEDCKNEVSPVAVRFPYDRPEFLQLSPDEVQVSADHISRPIIVPRELSRLPWNAGYGE